MYPQQGSHYPPGQNYGSQNYGGSSYRGGFMPPPSNAEARSRPSPSGTTTRAATVLSAVLLLAWVALLILGVVDDPEDIADQAVFIAFGFIVPMLPVVLGTMLLLLRKPAGRWVALAGFVVGFYETLLLTLGMAAIGAGALLTVLTALAALGATVAGIVLVALPATGRYLRMSEREDSNLYLDPYRQLASHQARGPYQQRGHPYR